MRPPRARHVSGAILAVAFIGCGARTGMLDPSAVGIDVNSNQPSDGASGAASHSGGPGGAPPPHSTPPSSGGAGPIASGGATGIAGSPNSVSDICVDYCGAEAKSSCPNLFATGGECLSACDTQLSSQTPQCRQPAADLLRCILPIVAEANGQCADVLGRATQICSSALLAYDNCAKQVPPPAGPAPIPTPVPTPIPAPPACSSGGSASATSCSRALKCSDGTYFNVTCMLIGPAQSACTCNSIGGVTGAFGLNESVAFACDDALVTCNGGRIPPK